MKELEIKGINETVYYGVCDNGLKIYVWQNDKTESVNMSLAVKYGSVHTDFTVQNKKCSVQNGTAHFLEHVKFNESSNATAHDFFYKTGADVNAFTTFDYTSYYVSALDNIEKNLIHLLDFVQNPYFTKELINKEKGIICEEEKMGEDNPDTVNYFGIFENLFDSCKYKNLVTGNLEDIKRISLEDIETVFNNFYHPENMALFITGNVNPYEIKMVVNKNQNEKVFAKYTDPKVIVPKEKSKVKIEKRVIEGNVTEPRVKLGVKVSKNKFSGYSDFEIRLAINLALNMNFGSTSDLKEHLLHNHLASKVGASADIYDDYVIIVAGADTRFPNDVLKLIKEKIVNLEIDKKSFDRKIKALISTFILDYDSAEKVNAILQDDFINYGEVMTNAKEKYENLTINNVKKIVDLIDFKNVTEFIMEPKK